MKKVSQYLVAGLFTVAASSAFSAAGHKFDALDKDKNGTISAEEAMKDTSLMSKFKTLDSDSDGQLSKTEYDAVAAKVKDEAIKAGKEEVKKEAGEEKAL